MTKLFKICKKIIREFLKASGLMFLIGLILTKYAFPNKSKHYIFIYQGIGDIIITRGYIDEYIKRNNISRDICFVLLNRYSQVYDMYSDNYERRYINELVYKFLGAFIYLDYGFQIINQKENVTIIYTGMNLKSCWNYLYSIPNMNFMYFIKYGILNLDDNANFIYPQIQVNDKTHINSYNLENQPFIILNPYANSLYDSLSDSFWIELACRLKDKGYRVFTDCGKGDKKTINGTESMITTMGEMYEIGKIAEAYIGIRSGMLDLLSLNNCKIIALYPKTKKHKDEYFQAFDVNALNRLLKKKEINNQYMVNDERLTIDLLLNQF